MIIGLLHPGAMGSQLARTANADVVWSGTGRSPATFERALALGLEDVGSVEEVSRRSEIIVSICPPAAAELVAGDVAATGFDGIYVDANAVAPATAERLSAHFARFVDGSVVGPPPQAGGTTRFYLAGPDAETVASLWAGSDLEPVVVDGPIGSASAVKMAYAGWTKGSAALLLAVAAYADRAGVSDVVMREWDRSISGLTERLSRTAAGVGPKAWRFTGEMEEVALALEERDLPAGFHEAAAEIYVRVSDLKGSDRPDVTEVIESLFND